MTTDVLMRRLGPELLAFHFTGGDGITATELGEFLLAAEKALKPQKIQLQVVGIERGSLSVIFRPIAKEIKKAPIVTALAVATFLSGSAPVQKVTAQMVNNGSIAKVEIVNNTTNIVIMDKNLARNFEERTASGSGAIPPPSKYLSTDLAPLRKGPRPQTLAVIKKAVEQALDGDLVGNVFLVDDTLHFRPEGRKFLVPIRFEGTGLSLEPNARYKVRGDLRTRDGQPEEILIRGAALY
ncbi:hypothetical protein ACSV5N_16895 [Agrobacterium salinitolerans]|uniref:hypothetical protein n=1 Tax=Agrobacterium salinitolerans TaxID=1183413 RepID=UPI003FD343E5